MKSRDKIKLVLKELHNEDRSFVKIRKLLFLFVRTDKEKFLIFIKPIQHFMYLYTITKKEMEVKHMDAREIML